jgi:hypothetical protein
MNGNGQPRDAPPADHVLRWSGRVVAAEDLRRALNGHRELLVSPQAVITPLASEQLRERGVQIRRQPAVEQAAPRAAWGYSQDRPHPMVTSAVQALRREGLSWKELPPADAGADCQWARALAECIARGECGGVVFCQDPGLVCCVANKVAGLRAVAVCSVAQASRALLTLGPNLVAVEMPGRTFFEIRQILRVLCTAAAPACPPGIACTLQELDGHAHR